MKDETTSETLLSDYYSTFNFNCSLLSNSDGIQGISFNTKYASLHGDIVREIHNTVSIPLFHCYICEAGYCGIDYYNEDKCNSIINYDNSCVLELITKVIFKAYNFNKL